MGTNGDIAFSCVITNYSHVNILLLLFYLFYVYNFFIVLLLLLCHVCYCDACKYLHGLGICVWFYPNKLMMMMMMNVVAGYELDMQCVGCVIKY